MFLYAKVVLSSIEFLDDIEEVSSELKALPKDLDEASVCNLTTNSRDLRTDIPSYARILLRINQLHPTQRDKARRLLGWIACSPIPMTKQEIQYALAVKLDDDEGKVRLIADIKVNKLCGPIVEMVDGYVQFVHFTVKEWVLVEDQSGAVLTQIQVPTESFDPWPP